MRDRDPLLFLTEQKEEGISTYIWPYMDAALHYCNAEGCSTYIFDTSHFLTSLVSVQLLISSYLNKTTVFLSYQHLPIQLDWTFFHTKDIQQVLLVNPCHEKLNNSGKESIWEIIFIFILWSYVEALTVDIISRIIVHKTGNQVSNLVNTGWTRRHLKNCWY